MSLLTIAETAEMLSVHIRTIHRYIKANKLSAVKIGGAWRIDTDDINQLFRKDEVVDDLRSSWDKMAQNFIQNDLQNDQNKFQVCTIIDCVFTDKEEANKVSSALLNIINNKDDSEGEAKFTYTYISGKARFILYGCPALMIRMLSELTPKDR